MFNQPQNFTSIPIPFSLTSFDNDPDCRPRSWWYRTLQLTRPAQPFSSDILLAAGSVELGKTDEWGFAFLNLLFSALLAWRIIAALYCERLYALCALSHKCSKEWGGVLCPPPGVCIELNIFSFDKVNKVTHQNRA